jgi:DNA-binding MarR family transcriptional regulator
LQIWAYAHINPNHADEQVWMTTLEDATIQRDECFATSVRKASRRLTQLYDDALAPSGLRSTQFSILGELAMRSGSPPTLADLAEALVTDRSSLGHALRPLVRDGYVALQQGEADRRVQHIVLTDHGRGKIREGMTYWRTAQNAVVSLHGEAWAEAARTTVLAIAHGDRLDKMTREATS